MHTLTEYGQFSGPDSAQIAFYHLSTSMFFQISNVAIASHLVVLTEPVTHKETDVTIWRVKRHRDNRPVVDCESSIPSRCTLEKD
ncbi:hypothetical protein IEQ34_008170 [Dendrobium chrysotoxum]|uniref:Uncharacterized protein n=1 Tax=Dendrobium chrysotoxum TaxID=161865 RepID=A0AAV7H6H2_DENCH|nr:hypothetical protein IEQ34_008170 [Dendrobium chrysotoxum]